MSGLIFYILSIIILISAGLVVTRKNPVYSALWLVVTIISIAGIFILAGAEFLAVVQIFVYAGGVMVLYVFLIMLINLRKTELEKRQIHYQWWVVLLVCFVLGLEICMILIPKMVEEPIASDEIVRNLQDVSNTKEVGKKLYTDFLLPFEVASVLLVVAMIGAIMLGRKDKGKDLEDIESPEIIPDADEEGAL